MSARTNLFSWLALLVFSVAFGLVAFQYKQVLRANEEAKAELAKAQQTLLQIQALALEEERAALAEYELRRPRP